MIKVGIAAVTGRMGNLIRQEIAKDNHFRIVAVTASPSNPRLGEVIAENIKLTADAESLFFNTDLVIDFSTPTLVEKHVELAVKNKVSLIIGTTGLSTQEKQIIEKAAQTIPILYASNTSMGVTLMKSLVTQMAKVLDSEFDIEIDEIHHRHKVDAPSGTSLSLAEAAAKGRGVKLDDAACYTRYGYTGTRPKGQIGFSVRRGGGVVGEHTVSFFGMEECLEITHKGFSRASYVKGTIAAARWLYGKRAGLYGMEDVLGL
jgi:4-hydroxy-tetrahydrodipicolinate reductase